jgi:hypothetical protein
MGLLRGFMLKTVVTTLTLALAACSVGSVNGGDDVPTDGTSGDPRAATYDATVKPIMTAKGCLAAGTCHGNGVQNPKFTSFTDMTTSGSPGRYIAPSATNIIITKDVPTPGMHQNAPYLDATDKGTVSTWLDSGP